MSQGHIHFGRRVCNLGCPASLRCAALFRKTTSRNKELEARVEELVREVDVWKLAYKSSEDKQKVLRKEVSKLERNIGSLKVRCAIQRSRETYREMFVGRQPPYSMPH